jgi:hypothetical protein
MEYKPETGEPEDFAAWDDTEFELEWQLNRDVSAGEARKRAAEEEPVSASGPGTEYWLP